MTTQRILAATLALAATACASSSGSSSAPPNNAEDPCYDANLAATRVWNDETSVKVKAQVLEWGGEIGVEAARNHAEEVSNTMDRLTDDWARMRKAVCKDYFVRKTISKEGYQKRVDCLDRVLTRQRTFLTALTSPNANSSKELAAIGAALDSC